MINDFVSYKYTGFATDIKTTFFDLLLQTDYQRGSWVI